MVLASAHGVTGRAREILAGMAAQDRAVAPYEVLRAGLSALVARWVDASPLPPGTDAEAIAQLMMGAVAGLILQRLVLGADVDRCCEGFTALSGTGSGDQDLHPRV